MPAGTGSYPEARPGHVCFRLSSAELSPQVLDQGPQLFAGCSLPGDPPPPTWQLFLSKPVRVKGLLAGQVSQ